MKIQITFVATYEYDVEIDSDDLGLGEEKISEIKAEIVGDPDGYLEQLADEHDGEFQGVANVKVKKAD